jgi:hypothetical protein
MYCPNCATNNLDGARFCRACGADISLVPQALTGNLPGNQNIATALERHRGRRRRGPSIDKAIRTIFSGLGFLFVAIALGFVPMGRAWWFWMLIPAFSMLGGGVAEYMRFKQSQQGTTLPPASAQPGMFAPPPPQRAGELPARNTAEMYMQPTSVTEGTTRLLEDEAPTRHIGRADAVPSSKGEADS